MLTQIMFTTNRVKHPRAKPELLSVNLEERIYAIGDIHGRYDLFMAALKLILSDAEVFDDDRKVRVIVLGDFIDRGDDSSLVVDAVMALSDSNPDFVPILGNHEAALLDFVADPIRDRDWLEFGASQTLASYGVAANLRDPDRAELMEIRDGLRSALGNHLEFLKGLVHYTHSGDVLFTHAGIDPADDPKKPARRAALWGHPDFRTAQPVAGMLIVHGHYDGAEPVVSSGRICIDTGVYYSGRLTVLRLDSSATILTAVNLGT